jgi:hypothetical protein
VSVSSGLTRWVPLALVAAVGFLLLCGSTAGAATIKVNAPSTVGGQVQLDTSELGGMDVSGIGYPLPGGETRTVTGWSLEKILKVAAGMPGASGWLDAEKLPSVTLVPPSTNVNARISVSSAEITNRGIFGGGRTPVLTENPNGSVDFIKPGRNDAAGATYRYFGSVEIDVQREREAARRLGLRVSPKSVKKGGSVSFTVTVPDRSADGLGFIWTFREVDSGRTFRVSASGGSLKRSFPREGRYRVNVQSRADLGFAGVTGSFTVGQVKKDDPPRPSGGNSQEATSPPPASASGDLGGPDGFGDFGPVAPGFTEPLGGGDDLGIALPTPIQQDQSGEPEAEPELPLISGELIGPDVEVIEIPPGSETDPTEQEADESGGFGLPGEAWTLFGVGLLLGLGGFIELRVLSRIG